MNIVFDSKDYLYAATEDSGVFRSSNFGATWNKIFSITCNPTNYLTSMVISPNDKIFIGYSVDGVFQSTDNGNSWTNRETGLTSKEVFSLGIDKDGYIYAGTFMNGIFRSIISAFVTVPKFNNKIPENFILEQNYPNPFNPLTKIRYSIPYECIVKLKIYDALGREIKTAVNEVQRPGSYILDIDASGLSSGVYFYSLQAGDFNQAKKFILMR